uniref:Odorant-binding protein 19 n=1 Tax=Delia platura TaxID=81723 RepID=A0A0P0UVY9_9MUSC|nr:odorant-binding protein 19 [Delia platura]
MKVFITLAVVCLVAGAFAVDVKLTDEQKAKSKVHFGECVKQENVSDEDVQKLKSKDFANPSKNMKCFGACFFEKAGVLKDNEVQEAVVMEKLGSIIGEANAKAVLDKCKNVKGEDRCETGFKIFACAEAEKAKLAAA